VARGLKACNEAFVKFYATFDFTRVGILRIQVLNEDGLVSFIFIIFCFHKVHLLQFHLCLSASPALICSGGKQAKTITRLFFSTPDLSIQALIK